MQGKKKEEEAEEEGEKEKVFWNKIVVSLGPSPTTYYTMEAMNE